MWYYLNVVYIVGPGGCSSPWPSSDTLSWVSSASLLLTWHQQHLGSHSHPSGLQSIVTYIGIPSLIHSPQIIQQREINSSTQIVVDDVNIDSLWLLVFKNNFLTNSHQNISDNTPSGWLYIWYDKRIHLQIVSTRVARNSSIPKGWCWDILWDISCGPDRCSGPKTKTVLWGPICQRTSAFIQYMSLFYLSEVPSY